MTNLQRFSLTAMSLSVACAMQLILSGAVMADSATSDTPAASNRSGGLDEIVVTARKRDEKLLDTPVAVVAFSSKEIEQQAIYSLSDLADATPGLSLNSTLGGSIRNDRSFPIYIIRGMTPSTTLNPTTTVFIDGAPIISGQVEGLDDLERIEVLEGPQTAYFGRETFAGAINLVTKDPGNTLSLGLNVLAGDPHYYDTRLSVEGPIISDVLTARATYRYYTRDGSYRNEAVAQAAPGRLGNQSTQSESLELVARPVEGFKIKALYMYWADRDGPSAQEFIEPGQANCLGGTWFCGTVPRPAGRQPAQNTLLDAPTAAFLAAAAKPGVSLYNPPNKFGLARDAYHWSVGADYEIPSLFTISALSSGDNQKWGELQQLADLDTSQTPNPFLSFGGPYGQSFWSLPFLVEERYRSFSQELRLTSDAQRPFRWLVGANYAWTKTDISLAGSGSFSYFLPIVPTSTNNTSGFFGLAYDFLPSLTANVEGRYERDEQSTVQGIRGVFNNFTGRYILQYKFTPDLMAYATYSEGVNPGTFNSNILSLSPADLANLESVYGAKVVVSPEKLKNYELGLKGKFFDNTLDVSGDVYYDLWTNQINVASVVFIENGGTRLATADLNNGRVKVTGLEGKLNWLPIPHLEIDLSGAINATKIEAGPCVTCAAAIGGNGNVNGKQLPNASKFQGAAGIQYSNDLGFLPDWGWFVRLDDNYKSSNYVAADNLLKTPNLNFVNLRTGLTHGTLRLEAFVDNLTNEGGVTHASPTYDFANPFETYARPNSLFVGIPQLRTFGIRAKYKFSL